MVNFGRRDRGITTANTPPPHTTPPATTFDQMAAPTGVGGMVVFGRRDRGIAAAATPPPQAPPRTTFDRTGAPGGVGITVPGARSNRRTPTPTIPTTPPAPPTPPLPSWSDGKCPSRYAARPPCWHIRGCHLLAAGRGVRRAAVIAAAMI